MKIEVVREKRECPQTFTDFLIRIGGLNPFGGPNFRLVWGGSATKTIYGQMFNGKCGQHILLKYPYKPAWHFEEWKPGDFFCSPERWYIETFDQSTGMHTMGDYPFQGDYVCRVPMYEKESINGKFVVTPWPLSFETLELLVPAIWAARDISDKEKKMYLESERDKEREASLDVMRDAYTDGSPAFGGRDFDKSVNRERMLKELTAQKFAVSAEEIRKKFGMGHSQVEI